MGLTFSLILQQCSFVKLILFIFTKKTDPVVEFMVEVPFRNVVEFSLV